jgi:hypothetical protein
MEITDQLHTPANFLHVIEDLVSRNRNEPVSCAGCGGEDRIIHILGKAMFLDFVQHLTFLKNTTYQKLDLFPSSVKIMSSSYSAGSVTKG